MALQPAVKPRSIGPQRRAYTGTGDKAVIEESARKAEKGCPVSKVLNAEVTLDVTMA